MNNLIMVVGKDKLFVDKRLVFNGFKAIKDYVEDNFDLLQIILNSFLWKRRTKHLEMDERYKQIVAVFAIINPFAKKLFVYKKSDDKKRYQETRLGGYSSIIVGGHIEKRDEGVNNFHSDLILNGGLRELEEEGINIEGSLLKLVCVI